MEVHHTSLQSNHISGSVLGRLVSLYFSSLFQLPVCKKESDGAIFFVFEGHRMSECLFSQLTQTLVFSLPVWGCR